jgi:hypothetical protein
MRQSRIPELRTAARGPIAPTVITDGWRDASLVRSLQCHSAMVRFAMLSLLVATGCEQDLVSDRPDAAAPDTVTFPQGLDFACIDTPWPTTAPDPLRISGSFGQANATVEIHAASGDALLGQATTGGTASTIGKYAIDIATGGVAEDMYRKGSKTGYGDVLVYDPFPASREFFENTPFSDPAFMDPSWVDVWGEHPDPTKGSLALVVYDCTLPPNEMHPVAGATVDVPPGAHALYIPADHVISDATKFITETTATGTVSVTGLSPGTYDLPIHIGGYTYRSRPVEVRANTETYSPRVP